MKSFEQLAAIAYEEASSATDPAYLSNPAWGPFDELSAESRAAWIAIVKRLWAEFTNVH